MVTYLPQHPDPAQSTCASYQTLDGNPRNPFPQHKYRAARANTSRPETLKSDEERQRAPPAARATAAIAQ
jgi:hypothetical protein